MYQPCDGPGVYGSISVGDSTPVEVKIGGSVLAERKVITIQPIDGIVYYGYDNSVTSSTGTKIFKGQYLPLENSEDLTVYLISDSGTVDVRITEVA